MSKRPSDSHDLPQGKRLSGSSLSSPVGQYCSAMISEPSPGQNTPQPQFGLHTNPPTDVPQHTDSVSVSSACNLSNLGSALRTGNTVPKCFRITNVPLDWSKEKLLAALYDIDPLLRDQSHQLSLYPACCGASQTALLNLDDCVGYFRNIESNVFRYERTSDGTDLAIDSHFYGLTPLNIPGGNVVADVVAVTGLAGHGFGSWRSRETRRMWLKDFLPNDIKDIRIMTFGYDSSIVGLDRHNATLTDHRRNFIEQLENSRSLAKNRPIIFLGHSLGGILILQTLLESMRSSHQGPCSILGLTHGIFFFGTPHSGLRTDELEKVVDANCGQSCQLIMQLKEGSEFLENQKEYLVSVFERLKGRKIVNFYEIVKTPSVVMLEPGVVRRNGSEVQMVPRLSAQLYLPFECRIPVDKNHTEMVKFASQADPTYQSIVKHIGECIGYMKPDQLLQILSEIDQTMHKPRVQSLDCDPKFFWIFKNMDFRDWYSADRSHVLLLCGPPECRIREASSHIVDLANRASESGRKHTVLYFFCSTVAAGESVAATFALALLQQIVYSLLPEKRETIVSTFLDGLFQSSDTTSLQLYNWESLEKNKKVLHALGNQHWNALKAVFGLDIVQKLVLFLTIDGLGGSQEQDEKFVRDVLDFIEYLQERSRMVTALLTSRPKPDINGILDGLPCIEYNKERTECLNALRFENTRYDKIEEEHEGSLQWLWEHEQYRAWSSTSGSDLLLVEGKPGSGKSTLAKYFKRNYLGRDPLAKGAIVGCFFYSYREGEPQTDHSSMLRSILYDVLHQNEEFFYHFQPHYRQALKRASGAPFQWPYLLLKKILVSLGHHQIRERLVFVVDALDESTNEERLDAIELLGRVCSTKGECDMKVFLLSRPISGLNRRTLQHHKTIKLQDMNSRDISKFAEEFLQSGLSFPHDICRRAREYIVKNAQGVFVWVRLVKEELLRYEGSGYSKKEILDLLTSLPTELEAFYERILKKLEGGEDRDIASGLRMFRLVIFAYRPLKVEEFRQALVIPDDPKVKFSPPCANESFDDDCIQGIIKRLIHCGGNFLEIKVDSVVQVMHETVREFFLRPGGLVAGSRFGMCVRDSQLGMSIICVRYLMMCAANTALAAQVPDICSSNLESCITFLNNRPFINYALGHLKQHLTYYKGDQKEVECFIKEHLTPPANSPASYLLETWSYREPTASARTFRNRLLHTATRMKCPDVVETLIIAGVELETYEDDRTPLMVSAELGDVGAAKVLLSGGARIHATSRGDESTLHLAAANGHKQMIILLVDRGANIEAKNGDGRTALHLAAAGGQNTTVQLLIETLGANKEAEDGYHRTALHLAAAGGHNTTVQLLIETLGANKEAKDKDGRTAFQLAVVRWGQ